MHGSAKQNANKFAVKYGKYLAELAGQRGPLGPDEDRPKVRILDVGSYDVNGTLRPLFKNLSEIPYYEYVGLDIRKGPGVDVVSTHGSMPFDDNEFHVVVSTSCFEHDAAFWETFKEMVRVVQPGGLIYICTPSSGNEHCLPDRWRFLSGAYPALESWVDNVKLLESYIDPRDHWKDAIGIFRVLED